MSLSELIRTQENHRRRLDNLERILVHAPLHAGKAKKATITAGAIFAVRPNILLYPESGTFDSLTTIQNESDGKIVVLHLGSATNTITIKHNAGNIWLLGESDVILANVYSSVQLMYIEEVGKWIQLSIGGSGSGGNTLAGLSDTNVASALDGDHLVYNGTMMYWEPETPTPSPTRDLLTNGLDETPELIFAGGDVVWVES